jgi:methionyl-tRNA formyltransferase
MAGSSKQSYVVATIKPWNLSQFSMRMPHLSGRWHLIETPDGLTPAVIVSLQPRYIFFPHWSWKVPEEITRDFECICFHMTDVPYGRGGSPLQNLITRGHKETVISALRMTSDMDAGPVYMKARLPLDGSAQEIFERASTIVFDMISEIAMKDISPVPQVGEPVVFKRRRPEESVLPDRGTLESLYDHIRMLDADTYPRAYLIHNQFRLEFFGAKRNGDAVEATVRIVGNEPGKP